MSDKQHFRDTPFFEKGRELVGDSLRTDVLCDLVDDEVWLSADASFDEILHDYHEHFRAGRQVVDGFAESFVPPTSFRQMFSLSQPSIRV